MPRPKRQKPNDLKTVHDRRSKDLLRNDEGVTAEIIILDPYGDEIKTLRRLRNDPLAGLHARKHIDEAQYQGGRAFQHDFETAERGPRAIDPSKEAVDGGLPPDAITESQRKAAHKLKHVYWKLGCDGAALAHDVLIHGKTHKQVAESRGLNGERWENYFGMRFKECLDCLAIVYGFAMEKR